MKKQITFNQLKKLVKEGYSYWSHGDHLTGWDDMACAIEDKWGKKIHDMTEDEKHEAYVDFALRDYGCNPVHIQSNMVTYTKGAASRYASDLVWGQTSDWPDHIPTVEELVARFEAYARDRALRDFVDEVKEELEEHELKDEDLKGWLEDEVKKAPEVVQYSKGLDVGELEDYEKTGIENSFKDKFIDSIGAKMWKVFGGKEGIRKAFYSMGCYDELGDDTFTDREHYYTHEKIPAETSPEQLCADWDNFVSQMGFDGAPEWAMELLYQRGYYKYYAAGNTSWSNPGGRDPKRTYADLKKAMTRVTSVAENSKVTLTFAQLKKLVKEGTTPETPEVDFDEFKDVFVDQVYSDNLLEAKSLDVLVEKAGMSADWGSYADRQNVLFVLDVKYEGQGDWDKFNKDGRAEERGLSEEGYWDMIQTHNKAFYDDWDAKFLDQYQHDLFTAGRSGGYWGIKADFLPSEDRDFIVPDDATLKELYQKALAKVELDPEGSEDDWAVQLVDAAMEIGVDGPDGWSDPERVAQYFKFNPEFVTFCKDFEQDLLQRSESYKTQEFNDEEFANVAGDDEVAVTEDVEEGGEPTFDISAAIKAGNIRFEGIMDSKSHRSHSYVARSKPVSHPSAASAHLFGVSLFQPCDGGFLNLDFDFDMGHAGVKYYFGPDTNETPWDNRRRPLRGEARKIDDALADDIKNNQDLLNALKDFINYHAPQDNDPVGNNARKMEDMLKRWNGIGAYIDSWNARVEG